MHEMTFTRRLLQCACTVALTVVCMGATASSDKPGEG